MLQFGIIIMVGLSIAIQAGTTFIGRGIVAI